MIKDIIKKHIETSRTPVSNESYQLVQDIADILNAEILSVQSGSEVLTWVIPEYWHVKKGVLKRLNGEVLADFNKNPLYLWTNSINFQGVISKEELSKHIFTDELRPSIIPYHYKQGFSIKADNWGFSLPYNLWSNMNDSEYEVDIQVDIHNNENMLTGVSTVGNGGKTYIFAAHTCHPAQGIDGLSNVALLTQIFKKLQSMELKNTYKFVFGPEYYAAAVFLERLSDADLEKVNGAFFLDVIGANTDLAFSSSFFGDSFIDKVVEHIFSHKITSYEKRGYRDLIGNDETFYNGPFYRIPTITLGQILPKYYHTSDDNYSNICFDKISEYENLIFDIINIIETDYVPVLKYKGPLCLSRHGLFIDLRENINGYNHIEYAQIIADGKKSCFDIALQIGSSYSFIKNFFDMLKSNNLIDIKYAE